jgi:TP901 family phage tail tape measure protein
MAVFRDDVELKFGADTSEFNKALKKMEKDTRDSMEKISSVTNTAAVAFVGLASAIGVTTAAFAEYEKGLIGVQKTSNLSDEETQKLGDDLVELSKKAPLAVNSLLEIAEAAGQLGIKGRKNIVKFTDTVAKLEATTNLKGEEAAKTLARILNVTGEDISNVDKLGSALVQLGNNVAASEAEIAGLTGEVAKSTAIFKLGAANVTGIGASLAELGIQAEIGGSVVGRAFIEIKNGIDAGGESLQRLSTATGIAAEDLKGAFAKDATGVFQKFLGSVKGVVESGGNATEFLDSFALKGAGVAKVIAPLSLRVNDLSKNIAAAGAEFSNATALENEFAKASTSISAQLKISQNKLEDAQRTLGEKFAPTVIAVTNSIANFVDKLSRLDDSTITTITQIITATAVVAGLVTGIGLAIKAILAVKLAFIALSAATGPIGLFITGLSLATTAVVAFFAVAPDEAKKGGEKVIEEQKKTNEALIQQQKESNQKQLGLIQSLEEKKKRIINEFNEEKLEKDQEAAEKEIEIQKLQLEAASLIEQGAQQETIKLKNDELATIQKINRLGSDNKKIDLKKEKTALELIEREANKTEIEQLEQQLINIREKQSNNSDEIEADIGDFEERTRKIVKESFEKKLEDQKKQLEDVDALITNAKQKGSYPDQEKKLETSLDTQSKETAAFYEDELGKRKKFLEDYADLGEPTTTTTTTDDTKEENIVLSTTGTGATFDTGTEIARPLGVTREINNTNNTQTTTIVPIGEIKIGIEDNAIGFITARQVENEQMGLA